MSERIPCLGCIYRHPGDYTLDPPRFDECRRFPPQVVYPNGRQQSVFPWAWAVCGEYRASIEPGP